MVEPREMVERERLGVTWVNACARQAGRLTGKDVPGRTAHVMCAACRLHRRSFRSQRFQRSVKAPNYANPRGSGTSPLKYLGNLLCGGGGD